ncbi:unnamed protein product [Trifolium pratense]|uniref:Uncharacterized protein n=1 Tax=Trifolium pratense TaxID=57577 RepID=A0ACB0JTR0_TRIPR|nr:unnamed protein product [Trifolium pratense]
MDLVLLNETIDEILKRIPSLELETTGSSVGTRVSKSNIEGLTKALQIIQPMLKNLHLQSKEALASLRNLKNAINDIIDSLEELSIDYVLPQHKKLAFFKTADPRKDRFKAVNSKIKNVIVILQKVIDDECLKNTTTMSTQEAHEKIQDRELDPTAIGRQKEKKQIIDQLMPFRGSDVASIPDANDVSFFDANDVLNLEESDVASIPEASDVAPNPGASDVVPIPLVTIVGFAGIGKKELVRLICDDKEVKAHFGSPIRVRDLESDENGSPIQVHVVESVEKHVDDTNQKRYLVVMEDLETEIEEEDLKKLQAILTGRESAILITTSSKLVANNITATIRSNNNIAACFTSFRPHVLQELNEKESWSLFWRIRGPSSNDNMGEIERKIVTDCGGVPLLITFAAEFLNNRGGAAAANDIDYSREFLKKLKFEYYDKLSRLHKMCFAFCSLFPRDHLIDVQRLIHLLKAEGFGFLMDVNNTTVEENLSQYFNDFLQKPIFKDIEEDKCGVVRKCRMQPLMHDLACLVSDQEENIKVDPEGEKVHQGVLRASFDFSLDVSRGIPPSLYEKAKKLRAILLWKTQTLLPKEVKTSTSTCDKIIKYFKITLRMLDLHDMGIKTLPASISEMNCLRYLDLSFNTIEKLPSSITKLSNLQTLKLSQCYLLKELPTNIDELTNLNHLEIDGCLALTQMPEKIHKLNNSLQTLTSFVVSNEYPSGGLEDLGKLNNLRDHLEISHLETSSLKLSENGDYLKEKKHLQHLTLRWDHEEEGDSSTKDMTTLECLKPHSDLRSIFLVGYKGTTLSTWFSSMQSLVKLSLCDCTSCIYLPQLDQLPKLRFVELLRLDNLAYIVKENGGDNDQDKQGTEVYFPSLEELTISDCPNVEGWWKNDTTKKEIFLPLFACLSKLHVYYCPKLVCMPLFPGLDEELVLVGSSVKPLIDSIEYSKTRYNPFSKLKYMKIASIEESGSPPERWIKYFNSLEKLDIKDWKHLQSFPKGFGNLASLQSLNIENCQELDLDLR